MKYIIAMISTLLLLGGLTIWWLNQVQVARVMFVEKAQATKAFEVDDPDEMHVFYVPAEALQSGNRLWLVRAGHIAEVVFIPTVDPNTPKGRVAIAAKLQDREMAVMPPLEHLSVGMQVRAERFGSGY